MSKKGKIGFWDLVFMNVSACYGIRWIAKSTASAFGLGLGAIPMWVIFSFIFFIPEALVVAEFTSTYPSDGGIYEWVKEGFGEKWGFLTSWLNWTSKIFFYSSFLTFLAVDVAYMFGVADLAENRMFVLILSLAVLWAVSLASTRGMGKAKILTNLGALGSMIPTIFLIGLAFLSVLILHRAPSASEYTVSTMTPLLNADSLVAISTLMYGLSGTEMTANFINEMDNPKRDYPKAILVSAGLVAVMYVLGSVAITMVLPPDEITAANGIFDALQAVSASLGIGGWLTQILAIGIALSILGALVLYVTSPVKMLFGTSPKGMFPKSMMKTNEYHIPTKAIVFQAALISVLLIFTSLMPSVDTIYNVLVSMTSLSALLPYALLFASYIRLRRKQPNLERPYVMTRNNTWAKTIGGFVLFLTVAGIVLTATPVMDTLVDNLVYELEMVGGAVITIVLGLLLWRRYEKKQSAVSTGKEEELS